MQEKLRQAQAGKKRGTPKWVAVVAVVVILGVGGYFAYGPVTEWWAKRSEGGNKSSNTATQEVASAAPAAAPAEPATPAPPKELPVITPSWTLDVDKAKIPEGKANGTLSGASFMIDNAICVPQLLRLSQGLPAAPDRELQIFLRLNAADSIAGRTWSVSAQDPAGAAVPQVVKRWKADPRYAAQSKTFTSGYAMKLELGTVEGNTITGKIFLALPDTEQSVVAGIFKATTGQPNAAGAAAAMPGMMPGPGGMTMPPGGGAAARAMYERYGKKR